MERSLELEVKRLLGINAVQNIMSKFQYYYSVSDFDKIKEMFYPGEGTTCETPSGHFIGIDSIRKNAFGGFPGMMPKGGKPGEMPPMPPMGEGKEMPPMEGGKEMPAMPPMDKNGKPMNNMGGGRLEIHTLCTPVIEVAGDAKTAKGLWWSPGCETGGNVGDLAASWSWEKFAADFICEDGKWYIWHFLQIDIFCSFFYKSWTDDFFTHAIREVPEGVNTVDEIWDFIESKNNSDAPFTRTYFYDQNTKPWLDVVPPEPYESWN